MQWVPDAFDGLAEVLGNASEADTRRAAAMAALQLDAGTTVEYLARAIGHEAWATIPLAVAAGADAMPHLQGAIERFPSQPEPSIALGLLGHTAAIDPLLAALTDDGSAGAAAQGLFLLTGAKLHEEVQAEESNDDAVDDDDSLGLPIGRLSTSAERWRDWLDQHGQALGGNGTRVRFGVPFDPSRVLDELLRTTLPPELREVMASELSIRYRLPRRYSSRLLVNEQHRRIARLRSELQAVPRLAVGAWYADGRSLRQPRAKTRAP